MDTTETTEGAVPKIVLWFFVLLGEEGSLSSGLLRCVKVCRSGKLYNIMLVDINFINFT